MGVYISRIWGEETPKPIWIKFGIVVDIPDVITYTNFGDHRLRDFWVARGQIFPSPIDFHRRPYNTLALPCECVILCSCSAVSLCNVHCVYKFSRHVNAFHAICWGVANK